MRTDNCFVQGKSAPTISAPTVQLTLSASPSRKSGRIGEDIVTAVSNSRASRSSALAPSSKLRPAPVSITGRLFRLINATANSFSRAGIEEFTDDKVLDVRIQALMKKMTMEIDPDLAKLGFIGTAPVRIRIKTKSGVVCLANDLAKGNPEKPLSESDRKAKFSSCVSPIAGSETAARWWNELSTLELLSPNQLSLLGAL